MLYILALFMFVLSIVMPDERYSDIATINGAIFLTGAVITNAIREKK